MNLLTPKCRWTQFSLATMFVVVTTLCVWFAIHANRSRLIVVNFPSLRMDRQPHQKPSALMIADFAKRLAGRRVQIRGHMVLGSVFSMKLSSFLLEERGIRSSYHEYEIDEVVHVHLHEGQFAVIDNQGRRSGVRLSPTTTRASIDNQLTVEGVFVLNHNFFSGKPGALYELQDAIIVPKSTTP